MADRKVRSERFNWRDGDIEIQEAKSKESDKKTTDKEKTEAKSGETKK